jgi:hypothetical protein
VFKLTGKCPRCGESTEFILTRQDVKALYKAMKNDVATATKQMDDYLKNRR